MAKQSGRGKESFRRFTKTANDLKRLTIRAIKEGQVYSYEQVESWYNEILDIYGQELIDERLDYELWYTRAEDKAQADLQLLDNQYSFIRESDNAANSEDDEDDGEQEDDEDNTIFGYPVITEDECIDETDGSPRGVILLSLEELREYIDPIPPDAIRGIILRRYATPEGFERGYSVCVGATL